MKKFAVFVVAAAMLFALAHAAAAKAGREWLALASSSVSCAKWSGASLLRAPCEDLSANKRASAIINHHAGESLLAVDLALLRRRLARIPGVSEARVRRHLPDRVSAVLILRQPLAKWADGGLVDVAGHRYDGDESEWLPIFKGPQGRAAEVAEFYGFASGVLPAGEIGQVQLEDNGDWKLFLRDGAVLYLGRDAPRRKLRRYASHREQVGAMFDSVRAVDLRYGRGFSVNGARAGENKKEQQQQ